MNGHHQNCPDCAACRDEAMRLKAELGIEPALPADLVVSTEYEAVRNALLPFRYRDGEPVDQYEKNLVPQLLQLAAKYSSNGHYIARELEKMLYQVQRMPKTAPEHAGWFIATIESRLQRRTRASRVNLPATQSLEARRILSTLMEHSDMSAAPEERRARQFEREAGGDRYQAMQNCMSEIAGSTQPEGLMLIQVALWMVREGWSREFPRKAPVVEFGQRDERKKA